MTASRFHWMVVVLFQIIPVVGFSEVAHKTGNFFISYLDLNIVGGIGIRVERIYNSKSNYDGMFGYGWGSEYEKFLTFENDGSILVHEFGGGAQNRFYVGGLPGENVERAADEIVKLAAQTGVMKFKDPKDEKTYRQKLVKNAIFRAAETDRLRTRGALKVKAPKEGTKLSSNQFVFQELVKSKDGFVLRKDSGLTEEFNAQGRLARVRDGNGNFNVFKYYEDGRLETVTDNFKRSIKYSYGRLGKVEKIETSDKKVAEYGHEKAGENSLVLLTRTSDIEKNVYTFKYNISNMLSEVGYKDGTKMAISYAPAAKQYSVSKIVNRDRSATTYDLSVDPEDIGHRTMETVNFDAEGKKTLTVKNEYFLGVDSGGSEFTKRLISTVDGSVVDTKYNELSLPLEITAGGKTTKFTYDKKGRVRSKVGSDEKTILSYDDSVGKVRKVEKEIGQTKNWSEFEYDKRGNLVLARDSSKRQVRLVYDNAGRVISMVDSKKKRMDFKYDQDSRTSEISDPSLGSLKLYYKPSGEVDRVESQVSQKIAMRITSTFQELNELIDPAGVTLTY